MPRQKMQPRFLFRKPSRDPGPCRAETIGTVWLRLNLDGHRKPISSGVKVRYADWDADGQRVRGRADAATRANRLLAEFLADALDKFDQLRAGARHVTPNLLKNAVRCGVPTVPTLSALSLAFIAYRAGTRAAATITHYHTYAGVLVTFLRAAKQAGLLCSEVTNDTGAGLLAFVLAGGNGTSWANKVVRYLSQLLDHGIRLGHLTHNALSAFEYPPNDTELGGHPLTMLQVAALESAAPALPTKPLRETAWAFLFMCGSGLAHCDARAFAPATHLTPGPCGTVTLSGTRQKSGKRYRMPLTSLAARSLAAMSGELRVRVNHKFNELLKVIAACVAALPPDLTSHQGRDTFIDLLNRHGVGERLQDVMVGNTAAVRKRHYDAAGADELAAALAGLHLPGPVSIPPPPPATAETWGRKADRAARVAALLRGEGGVVVEVEPWLSE